MTSVRPDQSNPGRDDGGKCHYRRSSLLVSACTAARLLVLLYCSFAHAFAPGPPMHKNDLCIASSSGRTKSSSGRFVNKRSPTGPVSTTSLYGIKGFRAWFESQFPDAITGIPSKGSQEFFDHVLIDINQLLHVAVRRSTSDDHALAILMKELNACIELATPTKSLVLAMDGPPSAAKLATSRKRRLATLVKADWKQAQLAHVQKSKKLKMSSHKEKRLRQRYDAEVKTLRITPGTNFMERANQAMLYWAWQRMIPQEGPLSKVAIYISASDSPGEGEVKILDWILRKRPQGTLAIMGGDSDLVLEGLVIPPSICTHNVFVLLPGLGKRYLVVSLWETTRHLAQLLPQLKAEDIMRVRTDMVLLLILNGNDYLPKLRGSSGFNRVFRAYIHVVREWLEEGKNDLFLVDPDSLTFHLDFAIDFFGRLKLERPLESAATIAEQQFTAITPLGQLNNLVSTQFMPKPMRWKMIYEDASEEGKGIDDVDSSEEVDENEHDDEDIVDFTEDDIIDEADKDDDVFGEDDEDDELLVIEGMKNRAILRLSLGKPGTTDYHCYEAKYHTDSKIKDCKNELAKRALEDLLGEEFLESSSDNSGPTTSSYSWELNFPVASDCKLYLGGLLWNLQTYQDGICSDYGYNYGKRLSPTAEDLVNFFQQAVDEGRSVGKNELLTSAFSPPVKNGVSCLAALPSQIGNLIAEPYSVIPSDTVEAFYAECVSRVDNTFDIQKFSALCEAEVARLAKGKKKTIARTDDGLKSIVLGEDYWTVVFRSFKPLDPPFSPPPPVIEKFTPLFVNRRIKAARFAASTEPRERSVWCDNTREMFTGKKMRSLSGDIDHCGIGDLLASSKGGRSVFDVDYWMPFPNRWGQKSVVRYDTNDVDDVDKHATSSLFLMTDNATDRNQSTQVALKKRKEAHNQVVNDEMVKPNMGLDSSRHSHEIRSAVSPLAHLTQLEQVGMIDLDWRSTSSRFAGFDTDVCERLTLSVFKGDAPINSPSAEELTLPVRKGHAHIDSPSVEELVFQFDTQVIPGSELQAKEYLAAMALNTLLQDTDAEWSDVFMLELKSFLQSDNDIKSTLLEVQAGLIKWNQTTNGVIQTGPEVSNGAELIGANRKQPKRLSDKDLDKRIKEFNMEIDPASHPPASRYGVTPLVYLTQLEQADMIDLEWKFTTPSFTDFASISPDEFECVELIVRKGDAPINSTFSRELVFQRDREVTRGSKQQIKQYLASMALTRLLARKSQKWFELTFRELKSMLIPDYEIIKKPRLSEQELSQRMADYNIESTVSPELSISDQSSLDYLGQLHFDKLINATFKFTHPSPSEFASVAPEDFELVQLVVTMTGEKLAHPFEGELSFKRDRVIGRDQKLVKQILAASALSRLLDHEERPWTEFTYEECKARLQAHTDITADESLRLKDVH
ncbi:XRN 5'-3' exonuclease [Fragilaria crotonensis]|nr:XRN 5'-3' exonuclease [Fragilaria crotonensis]